MRHGTRFFLMAVAVGVAGCNQPAVFLKPPAFQSSENTVRDWNDVAHKITAGLISAALLVDRTLPGTPDLRPPVPIFVSAQAPDSAFIRQVATELQSDILRRGGIVALTPDGATVVNLDVDFVKWGPRDKPPGLVGTAAAIAAIPAWVIPASAPMSLWTATDAGMSTTGGLGLMSDLITAVTPTMNAEAVWRATIVTGDRLVMKLQEQIYIRAPDIPLYAKSASLEPVASWRVAVPLEARPIGLGR